MCIVLCNAFTLWVEICKIGTRILLYMYAFPSPCCQDVFVNNKSQYLGTLQLLTLGLHTKAIRST